MAEISRIERLLAAKLEGKEYSGQPLSRIEELLLQMGKNLGGAPGGGSGGAVSSEDDFSESDIEDILRAISTEND